MKKNINNNINININNNNIDNNDYKFISINDIITSLISFIILIITQILDYFIDFLINYVYISSSTSSTSSTSSSSLSSLSLISSISILLLSLIELLIYRYNNIINIIIYFINSIIIIINKIRLMIIINEENNDNILQLLANDAKIKIDTHNITTIDGYILGLHRCSKVDNNNNNQINNNNKTNSYFDPLLYTSPPSSSSSSSTTTLKLPVVLLLHGLLQSSDTFLADGKQSLVSLLVSKGYDVWLGNTRGNKYSNKHINYNQYDRNYWNFCLDDYANYDVPAMILYIRNLISSNDKISIIGFSQGSAEVFASLSIHPSLNQYINIFIALAPPIKPIGLNNNILSKLIHKYPNIINLILGYKSCFPYMPIIKKILGYKIYVETCTNAMKYLFGWNCLRINENRRHILFKTIFSYSSVKCIKHWFQMIKSEELNIYQDTIENDIYNKNLEYNNNDIILNEKDNIKIIKKISQYKKSLYKKMDYNMNNIECKVAVIAGDADRLIDPYIVKKKIKNCQITYIIKNYEHLDLLWADDANIQVFPKIIKLLEKEKNNI